jgi:hypothetical protein
VRIETTCTSSCYINTASGYPLSTCNHCKIVKSPNQTHKQPGEIRMNYLYMFVGNIQLLRMLYYLYLSRLSARGRVNANIGYSFNLYFLLAEITYTNIYAKQCYIHVYKRRGYIHWGAMIRNTKSGYHQVIR